MTGWISVHRELMTKAIWKCSTPEQKVILITLLLMANHSENEWVFNGEKYTCKPGQFITSLQSIKENCGKGISLQNIRTALVLFEKLEFLTNKSTKQNRLITICNYVSYQGEKRTANIASNNQLTNNQQSANSHLTTNNNDNNDNNLNKVNKKDVAFSKKNQPASKPKDQLFIDCIKSYDDWIKNKTGLPSKIDGQEEKAMQSIIVYLKKIVKEKNSTEPEQKGDTGVIGAWSLILNNLERCEPFYQKNIKISQLNSNIVNIVNQIKNGTGKKAASDDAYRSEFAKYSSNGGNGNGNGTVNPFAKD